MATRAALRKLMGKKTGQPYFRRFGGSAGTGSASGTTTTLIDTVRLKEIDNYWKGSFIYFPTTDEVREINGFTQSTSTVTWLAAIAGATGATTSYEIWSQFTPAEIHAALDTAFENAWPDLFETATDESLVVKEDGGLTYTLPTTHTIKRLAQVWLIAYGDGRTGTVTTLGTTAQVIDSAANFVAADVGKYVACYNDGGATATGQVRLITARVSATELTVSVFGAALPVGAKYRILDKSYMYQGQTFIRNWRVDPPTNPVTLYLGGQPVGFEGFLIRLCYEYELEALTTEAASQAAHQDYIINAAMASLYLTKIATSPATEMDSWVALQTRYEQLAEKYRKSHHQTHIAGTITRFNENSRSLPDDYPF